MLLFILIIFICFVALSLDSWAFAFAYFRKFAREEKSFGGLIGLGKSSQVKTLSA